MGHFLSAWTQNKYAVLQGILVSSSLKDMIHASTLPEKQSENETEGGLEADLSDDEAKDEASPEVQIEFAD